MSEETNNKKAMFLFKNFIGFLTIYGQENFGENCEIRWEAVYDFCTAFDLFDFNDELEEIIYTEDEEEFRDKCYAFIEKQVLNDYPVWRLFKISDWLNNQFEKELEEKEIKKDKKYFNSVKCYHCKHYAENMQSFVGHGYPIKIEKGKTEYHVFDKLYIVGKNLDIIHFRNCLKRDEILAEYEKENHSHFQNCKFEYKEFNNVRHNDRDFIMNPARLKKCPYYEESEEIKTYEDFIKNYHEMARIERNDC